MELSLSSSSSAASAAPLPVRDQSKRARSEHVDDFRHCSADLPYDLASAKILAVSAEPIIKKHIANFVNLTKDLAKAERLLAKLVELQSQQIVATQCKLSNGVQFPKSISKFEEIKKAHDDMLRLAAQESHVMLRDAQHLLVDELKEKLSKVHCNAADELKVLFCGPDSASLFPMIVKQQATCHYVFEESLASFQSQLNVVKLSWAMKQRERKDADSKRAAQMLDEKEKASAEPEPSIKSFILNTIDVKLAKNATPPRSRAGGKQNAKTSSKKTSPRSSKKASPKSSKKASSKSSGKKGSQKSSKKSSKKKSKPNSKKQTKQRKPNVGQSPGQSRRVSFSA